jgi:hypothetical protein
MEETITEDCIVRKRKVLDDSIVTLIMGTAENTMGVKKVRHEGFIYERYADSNCIMSYKDYTDDLRAAFDEVFQTIYDKFNGRTYGSAIEFMLSIERECSTNFSGQFHGFDIQHDVHSDHISVKLIFGDYNHYTYLNEVCRIYEVHEVE